LYPIGITLGRPKVHLHVAAIGPTQARKRLRERSDPSLLHGIVFVDRHEHADAAHALDLLRARRERPCRRTAEKGDELASVHSITSSARSRIDGGTARPSAVAVLRFTIISNLVGNCTGARFLAA
jgi:hypothetical protein